MSDFLCFLLVMYAVIFLVAPLAIGLFYGFVEMMDYRSILPRRNDRGYDYGTYRAAYRGFCSRRAASLSEMRKNLSVFGKLIHYPTTLMFIVLLMATSGWPIWTAHVFRWFENAYVWLAYKRDQ